MATVGVFDVLVTAFVVFAIILDFFVITSVIVCVMVGFIKRHGL